MGNLDINIDNISKMYFENTMQLGFTIYRSLKALYNGKDIYIYPDAFSPQGRIICEIILREFTKRNPNIKWTQK